MFARNMQGTVRPVSQQRQGTPSSSQGLNRSLLSGIDSGRVTVLDIDRMRRQRVTTPSGLQRCESTPPLPSRSSNHTPAASGASQRNTDRRASPPEHHSEPRRRELESSLALEVSRIAEASNDTLALSALDKNTTFDVLCEVAPEKVPPRWLVAKKNAEEARKERSARDSSRKMLVATMTKSMGAEEALEVARIVARQEESYRRMEQRNSMESQLLRFADLEMKVKDGTVSRAAKEELTKPVMSEVDLIDRVVERCRSRDRVDKPFRHAEPPIMKKMASEKILKEEALKSFGDELVLLASKSDTHRLVQQRSNESRKLLFSQLMSWSQSVLTRGDLSDMLEDFISKAPRTSDGCISLPAIHAMMLEHGLNLSADERAEFDSAVDPFERGRVIPERLRHVWRSNDNVRKTKPLDYDDAAQLFDECMADHQAPITAAFLAKWLKRTGAPVDADVCHQLMSRLPRPLTKDVLFSNDVFTFIQDVWLEARAAERDVLSDAGMMDRAKQLDALAAETNDTLEDVDRANRVMQTSTSRLSQISSHFHKQLEISAKLASLIPTKYSHTVACNTDVSITNELEMLWEGFMVQRDMDLVDEDDAGALTVILERQNRNKSDEIVRLRTAFETLNGKLQQRVALLSQHVTSADATIAALRSQVEMLSVGPGGLLDLEDQTAIMEAHKKEVNELMHQMNVKLSLLRNENQLKVRELIHEVTLHKTRADVAEQKLLEAQSSTKSSVEALVQQVADLEQEVRNREDAMSNNGQVVAEYELKYQLQERRYKELEGAMEALTKENTQLAEKLEWKEMETQSAGVVPVAEMERRVAEVRQQLLLEVETERTSKQQFATQLQAAKSDLQHLEFTSLERNGELENRVQALEADKENAEQDTAALVDMIIRFAKQVGEHVSTERVAVAGCTDYERLHPVVCFASNALVDGIIRQLEALHSSRWISGTIHEAAVDNILRFLQNERTRDIPLPSSHVVDQLSRAVIALEASTREVQAMEGMKAQAESSERSVLEIFRYICEQLATLRAASPAASRTRAAHQKEGANSTVWEGLSDTLQRAVENTLGLVADTAAAFASVKSQASSVVAQCANALVPSAAHVAAQLRTAHSLLSSRIVPLLATSAGAPSKDRAAADAAYAVARGGWRRHLWGLAAGLWRYQKRRRTAADDGAATTAVSVLQQRWRTMWDNTHLVSCAAAVAAGCSAAATAASELPPLQHPSAVATPRGALSTPRAAALPAARASKLKAAASGVRKLSTVANALAEEVSAATPSGQSVLHSSQRSSSTTKAVLKRKPAAASSQHLGVSIAETKTICDLQTPRRASGTGRTPDAAAGGALSAASSVRSTPADLPLQQEAHLIFDAPHSDVAVLDTSLTDAGLLPTFASLAPIPSGANDPAAAQHLRSSVSRRTSMRSTDGSGLRDGLMTASLGGDSSVYSGVQAAPATSCAAIDGESDNEEEEHVDEANVPLDVEEMPSDEFIEVADASSQTDAYALDNTGSKPCGRSFGVQVSLTVPSQQGTAIGLSIGVSASSFDRHKSQAPTTATTVTSRPSSRSTETQTPPLPPSPAAASDAAVVHLRAHDSFSRTDTVTPAASDGGLPDVDATHRRVDSARRPVLPQRPQSVGSDRPASALRLDEASEQALRPATPVTSLQQRPPAELPAGHSAPSPLSFQSALTLPQMQQQLRELQQGRHFADIEFPTTTSGVGGLPLEMEAPLRYLFDALPPHCRIACAKYAMLAMFAHVSEDLFLEYLFTEHFQPNRQLFVVPSDAELRQCFYGLRRYGALLTRCKRPAGEPSELPLGSSKDVAAVDDRKRHSPAALLAAHTRCVSSALVSPPRAAVVREDAAGEHLALTCERPFSANSFPSAVVVLPLDSDTLDLSPSPLVAPVRCGERPATQCSEGPLTKSQQLTIAVHQTRPVDVSRIPLHIRQKPPTEDRPAGAGAAPVVALPVVEHCVPSSAVSVPSAARGGHNVALDVGSALVAARATITAIAKASGKAADQRNELKACAEELNTVAESLGVAVTVSHTANIPTSTPLPAQLRPSSRCGTPSGGSAKTLPGLRRCPNSSKAQRTACEVEKSNRNSIPSLALGGTMLERSEGERRPVSVAAQVPSSNPATLSKPAARTAVITNSAPAGKMSALDACLSVITSSRSNTASNATDAGSSPPGVVVSLPLAPMRRLQVRR